MGSSVAAWIRRLYSAVYVRCRGLATIGTSSATTATCASMGSSHLALISNLGGGTVSLILATEGGEQP